MPTFKGKITAVKPPRQGEGNNGAWASREFIVTESNPENPKYPQSGLFSMFKSGDYVDYALDKFPEKGTEVELEYNLKCKTGKSQKTGKPYAIQELSVWKLNPVSGEKKSSFDEDEEDIPF